MSLGRPVSVARRRAIGALAVLAVLGVVAVVGYRRYRAAGRSIPARGGTVLHVRIAGPEPHYQQRDPRWAGDTLGATRETIGAVGCLVCSLAMGNAALGAPVDPGELNRRLGAVQGFTPEARVIWDKLPEATGRSVAVTVHAEPSHAALDAALQRGEMAVVRFSLPSGAPHWVLVVGKEGDEYLVKDPLVDEPIVTLTSRTASIQAVRVLRRGAAR
jgi:hypothetical protein